MTTTTAPATDASTAALARALVLGFVATAIGALAVRLSTLHGGDAATSVVVALALTVVARALPWRRFAGGALFALGGALVLAGVPALLPTVGLGSSVVVVALARVMVALAWLGLPALGLSQLTRQRMSNAEVAFAAVGLVGAAWCEVFVGEFAAVVALVAAVGLAFTRDGDGSNEGVGSGFVVVGFIAAVVFDVGSAAFGPSVYASASVITVLVIGAALPLALSSTSTPSGTAWAGLGVALLWASATFDRAPELLLWPPRPTSFVGAEVGRLIVIVVVLGPSAVAAGFVRSQQLRLSSTSLLLTGLGLGLLAVFGLGAHHALLGAAVASGAIGLAVARKNVDERNAVGAGLLAICVLGLLVPPWGPWRLAGGTSTSFARPRFDAKTRIVAQHHDLRSDVVVAVKAPKKSKKKPKQKAQTLLVENGIVVASDNDRGSERVVASYVAAARGRDRALVLGAGSGTVARGLVDAGFAHVDVVDRASVVAGSRAGFGKRTGAVLDDAHVTVVDDSWRNGLERSGVVDAIAVAARPWSDARTGSLTSREFYATARARLSDGGVLVQRLSLSAVAAKDVAVAVDAARDVFASVDVAALGGQVLLVAHAAGVVDVANAHSAGLNTDAHRPLARRAPRHLLDVVDAAATLRALRR